MWTSFKFYKLIPGTVQRLIWNEPCPQINKANRTTPASLRLEISCGGVDGSDSPSRYTSEGNDNITFTGLRAAVARGSGGSPQRNRLKQKRRTPTPSGLHHAWHRRPNTHPEPFPMRLRSRMPPTSLPHAASITIRPVQSFYELATKGLIILYTSDVHQIITKWLHHEIRKTSLSDSWTSDVITKSEIRPFLNLQ